MLARITDLVLGAMVVTTLAGPWEVITAAAQAPQVPRPRPPAPADPTTATADLPKGIDLPADYVIGTDDVLIVAFWREKELSGECVVRPDGMITLPLINDIRAAGLTTDQLRDKVIEAASRFVQDPNATVIVKAINSRTVSITGEVRQPGPYPLTGSMTVIQLIARAGGLAEYADGKNIVVLRNEGGQTKTFKFNYKEVAQGKKLSQNIALKPGDTVIVP